MTLDWGKLDELQGIRLVFSRIRWENDGTESRLRIATESNLDCIYEIRNKDTDAIDQAFDEETGRKNLCQKDFVFNCKNCKSKHDSSDEKQSNYYLKLISFCKIDNLYTDTREMDSPHFYHQPYYLKPRDISERLIRIN